ncbi:hypothetical protein B0T21DRAFT_383653 [Apiosordaria backusii]|uniref:G-protein coupled receptors family 2 profile 2 domain-containing protein n=1 Tax=Apiosordaria backusii TaxID=314023 RepID=A0AA40EDI1_9PEZI|nr:hypothetical protein B0T21DRAFT_383653 [Apiosordaria backusii]
MSTMRGLTEAEADHIIAIEQSCSAISLLGCLFVLVTFSVSDAFRQRAVNRMVFYATFGNMLTNVATLMSRTYVGDVNSFGCQLQGFLIQVFMQGDAYWALAMAINVWLTFYHKYDQRMLRKMEIAYFLCCYGVPFIPGFTFVFASNHNGRPYGNAVLWCWLRPEWEVYRIALFYGPVWLSIIITMFIYVRAGREIYQKRRKMLNFSSTGTGTAVGNEPFSPVANEFSTAFNFKTTEVVQTTEIIQPPAPIAAAHTRPKPAGAPAGAQVKDPNVSYSVNISADPTANARVSLDDDDLEAAESPTTSTSVTSSTQKPKHARVMSSGFHSTQISTGRSPNLHARRRNMETNNATWSYAKCSILFFSALLITWVPSSGNRVYSMVNRGEVSKPLFFASAFVLPLQGFWNAIIYMVTSWAACKSLWAAIMLSLPNCCAGRSRRISVVEITDGKPHHHTSHHTLRRDQGYSGRQTGVGKWVGSKSLQEESTSMEDLTREGRSNQERVSPV